MKTIYTSKLGKKLFEAKVIGWNCKLGQRSQPKHGEKVIDVWWEWNGTVYGQYDILWFVGVSDHNEMMGLNFDKRVDGGYKTLSFGKDTMKLFKTARKLEYDLKRKYPEYQLT